MGESSSTFQLIGSKPGRLEGPTPPSNAQIPSSPTLLFHRFNQRGTAEGKWQTRPHSILDSTWQVVQDPSTGKTTPDGFLTALLLSLLVPTASSHLRCASAWLGAATLVVFNTPTVSYKLTLLQHLVGKCKKGCFNYFPRA